MNDTTSLAEKMLGLPGLRVLEVAEVKTPGADQDGVTKLLDNVARTDPSTK